jgi:hypothetical protein
MKYYIPFFNYIDLYLYMVSFIPSSYLCQTIAISNQFLVEKQSAQQTQFQ